MNGKVAKKCRRMIYGEDFSPRYRQYSILKTGQIIADQLRRRYQFLKRIYGKSN